MRGEDHSVIEDVVWGGMVYNSQYGFAILKDIQSLQAEQVCRTPEELKQVRSNYERQLKEKK